MTLRASMLVASAALGLTALTAPVAAVAHADDPAPAPSPTPTPTPAAAQPATYPAGSSVRFVAHVAGEDAQLASFAINGLTQTEAAGELTVFQGETLARQVTLVAAPVHGKATRTRIAVGSVLAAAPSTALPDPATLTAPLTDTVTYGLDDGKVAALARKLVKPTTVAPENATARLTSHLVLSKGYNGSTLDPTHLPATLIAAMARGGAVLPEKPVKAEYAASTLTKVIVVHTLTNRLQLFVHGKVAQTYVVATGQAGYPSPHGSLHVIQREPAPTWTNPEDPWSLALPKVIGPGPDNPLGTRALQLDSPGILIHGIPVEENATLGQNASHGCVRMSRAEIERLYPQIPVGTPVLLVS